MAIIWKLPKKSVLACVAIGTLVFAMPVLALGEAVSIGSIASDDSINKISISCIDGKEFNLNFDGMIKRWEYAKYNEWEIVINDELLRNSKISYECKINEHINIVTAIDTGLEPVYAESFTSGHRIRSLKTSNLDIFIKNDGNTIGTIIGIGTSGKMRVQITKREIKYCLLENCESVSLSELHKSKGIRRIYGLTTHKIE